MFKNTISQDLQDAIKKVMEASLHPNQQKIDVHEPEKDEITAHDFKKLRAMKKSKPMKEDPDWVIIEQDEDNTTAKVAGHKVTLHRSLSKPGMSDTYTLHHPSGNKKVTISYDTHGDGEEVHGDKVNRAFGLDSKHKLGHKIAGSMSGMGGISKFEESVEQTDEAHAMSHQAKTTMKHIPNASPALKKAAKDIKPGIAGYRDRIAMLKAGGVKEEAELDEANKESKKEFVARQGRLAAASTETAKDPERLKKLSRIPGYSAAMDLAKKVAPVKEEVEELDELKKSTLASYAKSAGISSTINRKIAADFERNSERSKSPGMKSANVALSQKYKEKSWKRRDGAAKAIDRLAKEEVEEGSFYGNDKMAKAAQDSGDSKSIVRMRDAKGTYTATMVRKQGEKDHKEISRVYDKKDVKEEVEELDELSKSTLGSYAKKATRDAVITRKIGADFEHQSKRAKSPGMKAASDELSQKYKEKSWKRRDGVDKAVDRLTKEEIELDEAKSLHKMSADELNQAHKDNEAKIAAIHKNDPSKRITMNHPLISKRRSINLHKVIRSKQSNPNYIPPPAHGYNEEANHEVAEGWDDMLKANKERAAAADKAKGTGKFDKKELSPGTTQYTRKSKTFTDGGSDADLRKANRKSNEEVDETTVIHNSFTVNLKEAYTFGEYLQAAKSIVGDNEAVMLANKAFGAQDVGIFEQAITIQNMIKEMNNLEKAGHSISEPKYNIELGNPYYEYTVTEDTGARRKYIHHGDVVTN